MIINKPDESLHWLEGLFSCLLHNAKYLSKIDRRYLFLWFVTCKCWTNTNRSNFSGPAGKNRVQRNCFLEYTLTTFLLEERWWCSLQVLQSIYNFLSLMRDRQVSLVWWEGCKGKDVGLCHISRKPFSGNVMFCEPFCHALYWINTKTIYAMFKRLRLCLRETWHCPFLFI